MKPIRIARGTLIATLLVAGGLAAAQPTPAKPPRLQQQASGIVSGYVERLRAASFKPAFVPEVVVKNTPELISYSKADRRVTVPEWAGLAPDEKKLFNEWARLAGGGATTGERLFVEFFNWFFVAHEMSHYLFEEVQPAETDLYEVERRANEYAVAFWRTQPGVEKRLAWIERSARGIQKGLPNPVPKGADPKQFFKQHYDELAQSPTGYGYFQFKFVVDAFERRRPFEALVQEEMKKAR